jgi:hypothetical protein
MIVQSLSNTNEKYYSAFLKKNLSTKHGPGQCGRMHHACKVQRGAEPSRGRLRREVPPESRLAARVQGRTTSRVRYMRSLV